MITSVHDKAKRVRQIHAPDYLLHTNEHLCDQRGLPGRSTLPVLVHPSKLKTRAVGTLEGRAGLIHALTHIEANAIDLALDMMWRFPGMPESFYLDWWQVAQEEALHFDLLQAHLSDMGYAYGDLPAHDGLWDMAERTKDDLLARLALVPRTLEARGLDATPAVRKRLVSVGDRAGAAILDIILRDEIGHVAIGNRWYRYLCEKRNLDPLTAYTDLAQRYQAPALRGPFNLQARRAAGFTEDELDALQHAAAPPVLTAQ
ncbi:MAG: ferritin-like domain-containing protein [Rhodoferax sp.]|nr:ferritin-like domain-containing protein [Rhodoferax sp.]